MTYAEFLKDIDKYVGYVVEFKSYFNVMFGTIKNLEH